MSRKADQSEVSILMEAREMAGTRRKARIAALKVLYEIDATRHDPEETLERSLKEKLLPEAAATYAREVILGALKNKDKIDENIRRFAPAFPVDQLATIDRNILRLAIFEILFDNKAPIKVAINEAVDLAKIFGSDSSPRLVNGVLGAVVLAKEKANTC